MTEHGPSNKLCKAREDLIYFINEILHWKTTPFQEELIRRISQSRKFPTKIIRPHKEQ